MQIAVWVAELLLVLLAAVSSLQELAGVKDLLDGLPPREACQVAALWDALLEAQRNCELMAARGVRISRDISKDWQETVADLIDRVVLQDKELVQLRFQVSCTTNISNRNIRCCTTHSRLCAPSAYAADG